MSRRGNYPISLSWDYYDDSKRGALGLSIGKNWRWLLMLLLLLLLAALIIMGWQNNRDNDGDGNGNAAVPAAAPGAVTAVPNAAYEGWRWVVPGGATPDGWDRIGNFAADILGHCYGWWQVGLFGLAGAVIGTGAGIWYARNGAVALADLTYQMDGMRRRRR